mmetsp:Transcript_67223/g.147312  ORF Transcript_67223/g.147312 Transcript_67223/m.147312 type:complete len:333 (+) Transcript_67223:1151-2149(+)
MSPDTSESAGLGNAAAKASKHSAAIRAISQLLASVSAWLAGARRIFWAQKKRTKSSSSSLGMVALQIWSRSCHPSHSERGDGFPDNCLSSCMKTSSLIKGSELAISTTLSRLAMRWHSCAGRSPIQITMFRKFCTATASRDFGICVRDSAMVTLECPSIVPLKSTCTCCSKLFRWPFQVPSLFSLEKLLKSRKDSQATRSSSTLLTSKTDCRLDGSAFEAKLLVLFRVPCCAPRAAARISSASPCKIRSWCERFCNFCKAFRGGHRPLISSRTCSTVLRRKDSSCRRHSNLWYSCRSASSMPFRIACSSSCSMITESNSSAACSRLASSCSC